MLRRLIPQVFKPRPTLSIDFRSGQLDRILTFTRASSQTYFDSTGTLQTAGTNIPAFDYDPVTLAPLGLSLWEGRTNLLLNSLIDGTNLSTQDITTTAAARTISFYGTGTIAMTGTHTHDVVGSGAFPTRTTYTYTPSAGTLTLTVTGTVQYAQDELGAFATPFIPTAGASAARAAPVCSTTDLSWFNANEGTFVWKYITGLPTATVGRIGSMHDGSGQNLIDFIKNASGATRVAVTTSNVSQGQVDGTTTSPAAYSYVTNNASVSTGGGAIGVDTTVTIPTVTQLNIGATWNGASLINGWLQYAPIYYPKRLDNATLQRLST